MAALRHSLKRNGPVPIGFCMISALRTPARCRDFVLDETVLRHDRRFAGLERLQEERHRRLQLEHDRARIGRLDARDVAEIDAAAASGSGRTIFSMLNFTSSLVKGLPSCHFTPPRS